MISIHVYSVSLTCEQHVFSKGQAHFGFFARDDIPSGTELLFDYEGEGSALRKHFPWVKHPNPPKKRKQIPNNDNNNNVVVQQDFLVETKLQTGIKVGLGFFKKY